MPDALTSAELHNLLATMLAGVTDGTEEMWWTLIGEVKVSPTAFNPKCDWSVSPAGTPQEIATIEHAVALVQAEHPYVRRQRQRPAT